MGVGVDVGVDVGVGVGWCGSRTLFVFKYLDNNMIYTLDIDEHI